MKNEIIFEHTPVLLQETLEYLHIQPGAWYVDGTLGGAGHTIEIIKHGGQVLGIDLDEVALTTAKQRIAKLGKETETRLVSGNFKNMAEIAKQVGIEPKGILLDLGVSSYQLSGQNRGFSFQVDEPLDMRMDPQTQCVTAKDLVNGLYENELTRLIESYGEDPLARTIARHIVRTRDRQPIVTTGQLKQVIEGAYKRASRQHSRKNPATRTFQALRIAVNDELDNLTEALVQTLRVVTHLARIVVISFHGLEDQVVKKTFLEWKRQGLGNILTEKPIVASESEIALNPRSRSAKLRAFEVQ